MNYRIIAVQVALVLVLPSTAIAQHEHHAAPPDSVPPSGSGTAWLPQVTPLRGFHLSVARWQIMIHGGVFGQFIRESGLRGNWQLGSVNWLMARADHALAGGTFGVRTMVNAEFLTLTRAGYPELLQVAQPYRGGTIADRMHPHELFGEVAVAYEHDITQGLGTSLYLAAAGEPALGPVAYRHRPSAVNDPMARCTGTYWRSPMFGRGRV